MKTNDKKTKNIYLKIGEFSYKIYKCYIEKEVSLYSANAAFFLITTSIPLAMLLFSLISFIPNIKVEDFITGINMLFPNLSYVRKIIEYCIKLSRKLADSNIISINIITAILTGSTALYTFSIGIRKIHNITRKNSFIRLRLLSIVNMFIFFVTIPLMFIFFLLGSMILGYVKKYIPFAEVYIDDFLSYRYIVAFIILFVLMLSLYATSTNFERKIKHNVIGALTSTFLWLIISNIFSYYFKTFPLNASVYGSIAGIVVILLWLYVCMNLIFLGSIINELVIPEKQILENEKFQILEALNMGNDKKVDKIIKRKIDEKYFNPFKYFSK